jgi:hypothetical protein
VKRVSVVPPSGEIATASIGLKNGQKTELYTAFTMLEGRKFNAVKHGKKWNSGS